MGVAVLLAIILGITIITAEFRHGTVTPTFLAAPHRERVIGAKTIAAVVVADRLRAPRARWSSSPSRSPWFAIIGVDSQFTDGEIVTRAAQQVLAAVLSALMGVAIGAIVQSQVAALVGTLVWIFVVENLLVGLLRLARRRWRDRVPARSRRSTLPTAPAASNLLSYWPGVAVSLALDRG